jgi:hypothetical protein
MSKQILPVIAHLPQLRSSLRDAALRLAFFADSAGVLRKSYTFLAADRHVHVSTAKRLIARLVTENIIEKTVVRLAHNRCAINTYRFTAWVMALVHIRATSSRIRREQAKPNKKDLRAPEEIQQSTHTDASRRFFAQMRRLFGLEEPP